MYALHILVQIIIIVWQTFWSRHSKLRNEKHCLYVLILMFINITWLSWFCNDSGHSSGRTNSAVRDMIPDAMSAEYATLTQGLSIRRRPRRSLLNWLIIPASMKPESNDPGVDETQSVVLHG